MAKMIVTFLTFNSFPESLLWQRFDKDYAEQGKQIKLKKITTN